MGNITRLKPPDNGLELFITDIHQPYTDPAYWELVNKVNKALKPGLIWDNGDSFDNYQTSRWTKDPKTSTQLQSHLDIAHNAYAQLRAGNPSARMVLRPGNHEDRLQTYLFSKAPELEGLRDLRLDKLLQLEKLEIKWIDNDTPAQVSVLYHLHGHEFPTGNVHPAQKMLQRVRDNVVFGHRHRFDVDYDRTIGGISHVSWAIGCGQILSPEYDFHPLWTNGFALIEYAKSYFHITPIEVFHTKEGTAVCVVYGKLYETSVKPLKLPKYGVDRE